MNYYLKYLKYKKKYLSAKKQLNLTGVDLDFKVGKYNGEGMVNYQEGFKDGKYNGQEKKTIKNRNLMYGGYYTNDIIEANFGNYPNII